MRGTAPGSASPVRATSTQRQQPSTLTSLPHRTDHLPTGLAKPVTQWLVFRRVRDSHRGPGRQAVDDIQTVDSDKLGKARERSRDVGYR
jgi:hypothetical protein